jgi:DNA-binding FrmR family transcriptional regulator
MTPRLKKQAQDRLSRIAGQVRGVSRMVDGDSYCIDVLTQLNSISSAIDGLRVLLLDDHVRTCVADAVKRDGGADELEELATVLKRFVRA